MNNRCLKCGREIENDILFCPYCGMNINKSDSKKSFSIKKLLIPSIVVISVVILLTIVAAIVTTFVFVNRLDETEKIVVKETMDSISIIGNEVTLESEKQILDAEAQYNALSDKCKRHVKNYSDLKKAREKVDELRAFETSELIKKIGTVNLNSINDIKIAAESYTALTNEQKLLVKNADVLEESYETLYKLMVENVEEKINSIGKITINSKTAIDTARSTYNNLPDSIKSDVSNLDVLEKAEKNYNELLVKNAIDKINAIGNVTINSKIKINNAEAAYQLVPSDLKIKVTNYNKLKQAKNTYSVLEEKERLEKITLSTGETFSTSKWQITYKKTNISTKILPNNTSGYYFYYYAPEEQTFVDIVLLINNIDDDMLAIDGLVKDCKVEYDGQQLSKTCSLFTSQGTSVDKVYSWDGLGPYETLTLHVAIIMPEEVQKNGKPISVICKIAGEEKRIVVRD